MKQGKKQSDPGSVAVDVVQMERTVCVFSEKSKTTRSCSDHQNTLAGLNVNWWQVVPT
jgi:hypothetical protein